MDDYIKRKQKKLQQPKVKQQHVIETMPQIVVRQSEQQLTQLASKVQYIDGRIQKIKTRLKQAHSELTSTKNNLILAKTPMQQSLGENSIFDRQTQNPNQQVQQVIKLESNEGVASELNDKSAKRQSPVAADEKLQQPSKTHERGRKARRKF